jgi:hypothetical protein
MTAAAAPFVDTRVQRVPLRDDERMPNWMRSFVGALLVVEAAAALVWLVWAYGPAEQLVASVDADPTEGAVSTATMRWWGPDFALTPTTALFLVSAAAGVCGSIIQQARSFISRSGYDTLERSFVWWYVLRPIPSALLGVLFVVTINASLVSLGDQATSPQGLSILVTAAAVAGLFTDTVLQKLRHVLGASNPWEAASHQPPPHEHR